MKHLAIVLLLAAVGCKDKSAKEAEEEDPALSFVAEGATEGIAKIKAAIAAGTPDKAFFSCAHTANIETLRASEPHQALAAELTRLCETDLPLAIITKGVEKAEAARDAKPDERVLSECFQGEMSAALEQMKEAKTEAKAKDVLARFAVACPDRAKEM